MNKQINLTDQDAVIEPGVLASQAVVSPPEGKESGMLIRRPA